MQLSGKVAIVKITGGEENSACLCGRWVVRCHLAGKLLTPAEPNHRRDPSYKKDCSRAVD